jgi:hypothetical protein
MITEPDHRADGVRGTHETRLAGRDVENAAEMGRPPAARPRFLQTRVGIHLGAGLAANCRLVCRARSHIGKY